MTHLESFRNMLEEAGVAYEYGEDAEAGMAWVRIEESGHEHPGSFFTIFTFSAAGKLAKVGIWE